MTKKTKGISVRDSSCIWVWQGGEIRVPWAWGQCGSSGNRFSLNRFSTDITLHMPSDHLRLVRDQNSAKSTLSTSGVAPLLMNHQEVTMKLRKGRGRKRLSPPEKPKRFAPLSKAFSSASRLGSRSYTRKPSSWWSHTHLFLKEIEPLVAYSEDKICFWFKKYQRPAVKMGKK